VTVPLAAPTISDAAQAAVRAVLASGMLADGEVVREFESAFASYVGVEHAVATSSGTTALQVMLEAAGIGAGDAVITTPFSFISSANAVVHAGAQPVFADIDPQTFTLDPDAVRAVLATRDDVAAILPVHLYGLPAPMAELRAIAAAADVLLFEDAAQAHGATLDGVMVGSLGDAAAFSFYPTKNMTTGEGGMITTDDPALAARARRLINHGRTDTYEHSEIGYNFRMTNIQAAIGLDQLARLPGWVAARRSTAAALTDGLAGVDGITPPVTPSGAAHAFHQYTVRVDDRARLRASLDAADIGCGVYYPRTIPDQPAYGRSVEVPQARAACEAVLSLPVHPGVDADAVARIIETVRRAQEVSV
jgi:dTDP-4-amino-4,6-dideoxygalactose transaminase